MTAVADDPPAFDVAVSKRLGSVTISASFQAGPGLTALVGPSGAGKTTLLNLIAGVLKPDGGHVRVAGRTLYDAATGIDLRPEARRCGYIFQDGRLFPHMSVAANLDYGAMRAGARNRSLRRDHVLEALGIGHLLDRKPANLSGGEAQRVGIGRALLAAPDFLLMDEPLSSLDPQRKAGIMEVIGWLRDETGLPILFVSHDPGEIAQLANQVIALPFAEPEPARMTGLRAWS
jgi:molybdate transport system ATP-binding protein